MNRFYPPYYRQYTWIAQNLLKLVYSLRARLWAQSRGTPGRALEIGCGDGWILRALRQHGWTVVGNERTVRSTDFASKINKLPVFVGGLAALKSTHFDLIIMVHVLEHMDDPLGTLQECARLLRRGGTLVVVVPNLESWQARWFGSLWFELDVPRHLFHFSSGALARAFMEAGLEVTTHKFPWLDHTLYGWMQSLLNYFGFPHNLLTKVLMGKGRKVRTVADIRMVLVGALLLIPSFILEVCSRFARAGAVMELCGIKRESRGPGPFGIGTRLSSTQLDQAFYDEKWMVWKNMQRYAPAPRYLRRMVMKEISRLEFRSVLDFGCGEGTLLKMIAQAYPNVSLAGSELSETAMHFCREQLPRANLLHLDIVQNDESGLSYDLIILVQVLEHLKDDLAALRKLKTMCRGYVLISVPGGELDDHAKKNGHYRHYTKDGLVQKMEQAGFRVVRAFTCGWPVHSLLYRQLVRHLPKKAVEQVGLGEYDWKKRAIMNIADLVYRFNLPFVGTEIFAIGVPTHDTPGASP